MKTYSLKGSFFALVFLFNFYKSYSQVSVSTNSGLPNYSINGVAYGNGVYVGVGYYNTIVKSTDGVNWTVVQSTAAINPIFDDVIFAAGKFVAIMQNGAIYTSSNGDNWTLQNSGTTNYLTSICYANGQFMVVGANGTALTSPDGVTWTALNTGAASSDNFTSVVYDGSKYVAGYNSSTTGVRIRSSTTGAAGTWTTQTVSTNSSINALYFVGGRYYIFTPSVTPGTCLYTSTNGTSWTPLTAASLNYQNQMFHALYDGSKYFLFGSTVANSYGCVFTSTDGINFTQQPQTTTITCQNVAYLNGKYFQTGNEGIVYSNDGMNWLAGGATHNGVATNGSRYVAVGQFSANQATIYSAANWNTLAPVTVPIMKALNGVTYGGGKFVAVGNTNSSGFSVVATSADGISWTAGQTGFADNLRSVAYGNAKYVAVGFSGRILYSSDATTWSSAEAVSGYNYYSVRFINNRFVAVGGSTTTTTGKTKVKYSADGVSWTDASPDIVGHFHDIAYNGSRYVLVGRDNVSGVLKFFSISTTDITDVSKYGSAVTVTTPEGDVGTAGYGAVSYANGKFAAVVNLKATPFSAYMLTSADGSAWIATPANTSARLRAITADGSGFKAVGTLSTLLAISPGQVAPVKLTAFNATAVGKTVQLQWQVAEQAGITAYEVQRSSDGASYTTLASVNSKPGTTASYSYMDGAPAAKNHYRLRVIEQDGPGSYSTIRTILLAQKTALTISSNPATGSTVRVRYSMESNKKAAYTLYSISGAAVQKGSLQNGINTIRVGNLKPGQYILQAESGETAVLQKL